MFSRLLDIMTEGITATRNTAAPKDMETMTVSLMSQGQRKTTPAGLTYNILYSKRNVGQARNI